MCYARYKVSQLRDVKNLQSHECICQNQISAWFCNQSTILHATQGKEAVFTIKEGDYFAALEKCCAGQDTLKRTLEATR